MSQSPSVAPRSDYQAIFDNALTVYKKRTGKDLTSDPLLRRLESCDSPDTVLAVLRDQIPGFNPSGNGDSWLTKWLNPTIDVLYNFSATVGDVVSLVRLWMFKRVSQDLHVDIHFTALSTGRGDLHWNWCLPLCEHLPHLLYRASVTPRPSGGYGC